MEKTQEKKQNNSVEITLSKTEQIFHVDQDPEKTSKEAECSFSNSTGEQKTEVESNGSSKNENCRPDDNHLGNLKLSAQGRIEKSRRSLYRHMMRRCIRGQEMKDAFRHLWEDSE